MLPCSNSVTPSFVYKPHTNHNSFICSDEGLTYLYLFHTHSISILYPFCSVLFCSHSVSRSIGKRSGKLFRRTRFLRSLQECFLGISDTQLKLSPYARIQTIKCLHFCGEIVSPVTCKIREEQCNGTSRSVWESFSETIQSDR